ncbi:AarF/UbiB family protein [Halobacteriovorax sp. HLS]|uniref:AarF/UbiB family protein n=1 Tax=Halobacteriovorax sp. HLS TaxID=2234000 RepID=UPI000FD946AD|nr:AarF/UbiB family protein [Halobacteriovorax sp. HLS]
MKNYVNLYKCVSKINNISDQNDTLERNKVLNSLYEIFTREKGLYLKLGQFLNQHKDEANYKTRTQLPFLSLERNLRERINEVCNANNLSIASSHVELGSIGCVIKVKNESGNVYALKIQYPEIEKNLQKQFSALNNALKFAPKKISQHLSSNFVEELKLSITEELDYSKEQRNTKQMSSSISGSVRTLDATCLTKDTLLLNWADGLSAKELSNSIQSTREFFAKELLKNYLYTLFESKFIQIDNQEDNFLFNTDNNIIYLLDLGNCQKIDKNKVHSLLRIITGLQNKEDINYLDLLGNIGFDKDKLSHISNRIVPLLSAIFSPFTSPLKFDLNNYDIKKIVDNILGEDKWWFRMAGNNEVFSLMRSYSLLLKTLTRFNTPIFFSKILKEVVSVATFEETSSISVPLDHAEDFFKEMSHHLNIIVSENCIEKVNLTFPSQVLKNIGDYMQVSTLEKLEQAGVDLKEVIATGYKNKLRPQTLIHIESSNQEILIKLN